jgi:diguanylate cyclase (GGDEF)-like protein
LTALLSALADTSLAQPGSRTIVSRETVRLLPVVVPVTLAGVAALGAAALAFAASEPSLAVLAGVAALLVASVFVEAFPVPVESLPAGSVSLAAVFMVGTAVLYGWAPAAVLAFVTMAAVELVRRTPLVRLLYNSSVYALAGTAAGLTVPLGRHADPIAALFFEVLVASSSFYAVNVFLTTAVVARWAEQPFLPLLRRSAYWTIVPFAIMASISLMLAVLWERSPVLAAALVGPVVAVALYQRSVHSALKAMRLALTDPLTGLGNHRHFHERLQADLDDARERRVPVSLCLIDIDDFKAINDRYGHPTGDRVLAQIASRLRQGGEAFRLGGDEFALLLPARDPDEALAITTAVVNRIAATECEHGQAVSVSAGIATYPEHGMARAELVRVADSALYWAKEHGKNRVRVYRADVLELAALRRLAEGPDRAARLRAAASLAEAVDARDVYTRSHSHAVGEMAGRIATRMGLDPEEAQLVRLAGRLHDLGKLAIPEEILRKPAPLDETERLVLERHPQIGFRMLDSLGIDPVGAWVLHHHERWDGHGYPDRLFGELIPLGSRIVLVADAYDAMTNRRTYRGELSHEEAVDELVRCAGTQFDPAVVAAFRAEFGASPAEAIAATTVY